MIKVTSNIAAFKRLQKRSRDLTRQGLKRGLSQWTVLAHKAAYRLLSGSGKSAAGSYPVPVRSGQLRHSEDYVLPGRTKHGIQAREGEAFLINSALYARTIHKDRPFLTDAIDSIRKEGMELIRIENRKALMKEWG